ncbi:uncharacterized protein [Euphorbia lathyris]|uniref:uncharacterized protein n=1 Tax=Euphorbia lathyris TaxID=212925 RepID=UPI003313658F
MGFALKTQLIKKIEWEGYDDTHFINEVLHESGLPLAMTNMMAHAQFLHQVVIKTLLPKYGSREKCSLAERIILWHLLKGKQMNFAQQIIYHILNRFRAVKKDRQRKIHLPYSNLLMAVFEHYNVHVTVRDNRSVNTNLMDALYLLSMATMTSNRGWILSKFVRAEDEIVFDKKTYLRNVGNDGEDVEVELEGDGHVDDDIESLDVGMDCFDFEDEDVGMGGVEMEGSEVELEDDEPRPEESDEEEEDEYEIVFRTVEQPEKEKTMEEKVDDDSNVLELVPYVGAELPTPSCPMKKLLILDLNGVLICSRTGLHRPHITPFMKFCFDNFTVAIWSSKMRKNIDKILPKIRRSLTDEVQMLFVWGQEHCVVKNITFGPGDKKCIMFKDLKHVWDSDP